jgi:hypothetical protein
VERRHLDGRAVVAAVCGVASLLVSFWSPVTGIFFGAWTWILAGASVIAVDDPASRRTRRAALLALVLALPALVAFVLLVLFGFFAPPPGE